MAHAIVPQVLVDGRKLTIVKYTIKGDGASVDLSQAVIFDASTFLTASLQNKIMEIDYCLNGFSATLYWDATSPLQAISLAASYPHHMDYWDVGGLVNNGGSGQTGDIKITTSGLNASTKDGFILFYIMEREVPIKN